VKETIYYATSNRDKFAIAQNYFSQQCPEILLTQYEVDLPERQTHDQAAIAREKAHAAWKLLQQPVLVDDGGMYFDAYDNFPGFMTRYTYYALGLKGIFKLLEENNQASFRLFLVYCDAPDSMHEFLGEKHGAIVPPQKPIPTTCKTPWNYLFVSDGCDKPYAALSLKEQTPQTSFRLAALDQFIQWYQKRGS